MTNIEVRFYEAAISFFTRNKGTNERRKEARAEYAKAALQGILSSNCDMPYNVAAAKAVLYADALAEALSAAENK